MKQFYLASSSPRRAELLRQVGFSFHLLKVDICEKIRGQEDPVTFVQRLAKEKALAGYEQSDDKLLPVLGSDTIIVCEHHVLGKPRDERDFNRMFKLLSNNTHTVYTAVSLCHDNGSQTVLSESRVSMREIAEDEIKAYWQSGEPKDKAGGYAIQGVAAIFIQNIEGSYSSIMGLPLFETTVLLRQAGIKPKILTQGL